VNSPQRKTDTAAAWARSDARFRALLQHSSDITTVMAPDGTVLYNTPSVERVLGYPAEEMIGQVALDFVHPDDLPRVAARFAEAVATPGVPVPVDFRFRHRDGSWVPLEALGVNYLDDENVGGIIVTSRDVRDRHRIEKAYRTLVDHSLQGLAIIQHGKVMFANQAAAEIMGYTIDELLALEPPRLRQTVHPDDIERISEQWRRRREGLEVPPRTEFRVVRKNGSARWVETYTSLIDYEGESAAHVAYVDITERRRADEEKSALLQIARDLTGTLDRGEVIARVLQHTARMLPVDHLDVAYWDPRRRVYRSIARVSAPPGAPGEADTVVFAPNHPLVNELRSGRPLVINDIERQSLIEPEMLRSFGVRSLMIAPLAVRDRASGALVALRTGDSPPFSDTELRLFDGIARQLALGLGVADRHAAEQEQAAISSALAGVGRELIASLSRAEVLPRLCEITARALQSDRAHAFLLDTEQQAFVVEASHGVTPEYWQSLRAVGFPVALTHELLDRLQRDEVVVITEEDEMFPAALMRNSGTPTILVMPLRRGDEITGLLLATLLRPGARFDSRQIQIARGIAQMASLTIEDARLVAELERANRLKSEFVATMSHELRTPLNIILGYNSLLLEEAFGFVNEEQRDTLQRVETNARSLLELINTTLDMSRLEAGKVRLELNDVETADVLEAIRLETRDLETKPDVAFVWEADGDLPPLHTDVAKLKVVLKNLIGNAVKFTDHGSIAIGARARGDGVEFVVADTGIGIDEEARAYIFEPFRQVDAALTRRHGGVGLGLYIVRRLLMELGGTVEVESEAGKGSTFRVWVPRRAAAIADLA